MSYDWEPEFRRWVWYENIEGQLSSQSAEMGFSTFGDLFPRDIDRDGDLDGFTLNSLSDSVDWYINDETFSRAGWVALHLSINTLGITDVADINGDGHFDFLTGFDDKVPSWFDGATGQSHLNRRASDAGDANGDGRFDALDLIQVFRAGEYEDDLSGNSTWAEGDWNGDGEFDSSDVVWAFQVGHFEADATPLDSRMSVAVDSLF